MSCYALALLTLIRLLNRVKPKNPVISTEANHGLIVNREVEKPAFPQPPHNATAPAHPNPGNTQSQTPQRLALNTILGTTLGLGLAGDLDPLVKNVAETRVKLAERRFPAFYREMPQRGREYLEMKNVREAVRWIDSLDQQ